MVCRRAGRFGLCLRREKGGGESEIEGRSAALKVEHDELMRIAREEAWNNKAFTD